MTVASFFSGCGGLDLGFENAGFNVVWANDNASSVMDTYKLNFPHTAFSNCNIKSLDILQIPDVVGIIGGPPCQSWSNAGSGRGILDIRGKLFFDYISIIEKKQPLFFVAENVPGILSERNRWAYLKILDLFSEAGYRVNVAILNSAHFSVPQNRKRVFFVGYREDLGIEFVSPDPHPNKVTVRDAIGELQDSALPSKEFNQTNGDKCNILNHEYWQGSYSYIFMSRNRVLSWNDQSFTIQASGRQVSIHPQAPPMEKVKKDVMKFKEGHEHLYRRLSIRECARLQTFPDTFEFVYKSLDAGYKMIGNSVPVNLGNAIAEKIFTDLTERNILEWYPNMNLIPQEHVQL